MSDLSIFDNIDALVLNKNWEGLKSLISKLPQMRFAVNETENAVTALLSKKMGDDESVHDNNEIPNEIIDFALETFASTDSDEWGPDHNNWTHSYSHFSGRKLWKLGMLDWVKRLHNQAFANAEKIRRGSHAWECTERLLGDILEYGSFDTNPADFGATPDRIKTICKDNEYAANTMARLLAMPFATQQEADLWEANYCLADPVKRLGEFNYEAQTRVVNFEAFAKHVETLRKTGVDVSGFEDLAKKLAEETLVKLRSKLENADSFDAKRLTEVIEALEKSLPTIRS